MYRALPEINRICAIQDRNRRYKMHQQALHKINRAPNSRQSPSKPAFQKSMSQKTIESPYLAKTPDYQHRIQKQASFHTKTKQHDSDINHQKQVAQLLQCDYGYQFNNWKRKQSQSKLSSNYKLKSLEPAVENYSQNITSSFKEPPKPAYIREHAELFQLDFSKVKNESL